MYQNTVVLIAVQCTLYSQCIGGHYIVSSWGHICSLGQSERRQGLDWSQGLYQKEMKIIERVGMITSSVGAFGVKMMWIWGNIGMGYSTSRGQSEGIAMYQTGFG